MNPNKWFTITNAANDTATVRIFDEIGGWGISAQDFANDLAKVTAKTIHLRINSPGGDVFAASAIYNSLRNHKARVISYIDGLAASAATIIMLAADEVRIAANGFVMIHEASSGVWGTKEDMQKTAELLGKLNDTIAGTYAKKTGKTREEMLALMNAETWFNADEAKEARLVDAIEEEAAADASAMNSAIAKYKTAPVVLRRVAAMLGATKPTNGHSEGLAPTGASVKAANPQETTMNMDNFHAFAADNPAAVATYIEQGKKIGTSDAIAAEKTRFKAIREACGDNLALACELFDAGKDAEDAKLTVSAVARAKAEAEAATAAAAAKIEAQAKEIERLTALNGTQGALGTGASKADDTPADKYAAMDDDARIEAEWNDNHGDCTAKFKVFNAYRGFRKSQMNAPKLPTK